MTRLVVLLGWMLLPSVVFAQNYLDGIGDTYLELRENFSPIKGSGSIIVIAPDDRAFMFEFSLGAQPEQTTLGVNPGGYTRALSAMQDAIDAAPSNAPRFCDDYGTDAVMIVVEGERVAELQDDCPNGSVSEIINLATYALRR